MGIKHLNRYLTKQCSQSAIYNIHLKELENRVVVVDASIFIYKFLAENALIENMYLFISILLEYNITPVFIFDGKPPPEKRPILMARRQKRKEAEAMLLSKSEEDDEDEDELLALKKQCVRVKNKDLADVKQLLDAYGIAHYEAASEADILCAYLVETNFAYACISDDMDMFLFGCPRVLRNISLMKHTGKMYDTECILRELDLTTRELREILVLSGTDYNESEIPLLHAFALFYQYKNDNTVYAPSFYVWLMKTGFTANFTFLMRTDQLFQFHHHAELNTWINSVNLAMESRKKDIMKLHDILYKDGFVFV